MVLRAASISEALYYADKTPAWLARKSSLPLRRVLKLQRRGILEKALGSDVRALRTALSSKGIKLTTEDVGSETSDGSAE